MSREAPALDGRTRTAFGLSIGAFALLALGLTNVPLRAGGMGRGDGAQLPGEPRVAAGADDDSLGSGACQKCHPSEHASFRASHHRSMTRRASELKWNGSESPNLPAALDLDGRRYTLLRDERGVLVRGPDLHAIGAALARGNAAVSQGTLEQDELRALSRRAFEEASEVERRLVLVTGSHHYLAFWLEGGKDRELRQLPFVYLLGERQWTPRREAFLQPPDAIPSVERWNAGCVQCHTTGFEPHESEGYDPVTGEPWVAYETQVAELGISCEACHGPGREHARRLTNPLSRLAARDGKKHLGIENPKDLGAERASAICGQCHAYFVPSDPTRWWEVGFSGTFVPGDGEAALLASRTLLERKPALLGELGVSRELDTIFWADGSVRVGGREYNALRMSACYSEGSADRKMSCLSCHSMHDSAPDDQLERETAANHDAPCRSCHEETGEHSGHAPGSPGASCVNCHMPKTTYALRKTIRSHYVTSPSGAGVEPPSACILCHVDRKDSWLANEFRRLFPSAGESTSEESLPPHLTESELGMGAALAISGNAAARALFAAALGSEETRLAVVRDDRRMLLEELRRDPYVVVARMAERSLTALRPAPNVSPELDRSGVLPDNEASRQEALDSLRRHRDEQPIVISE